MRGPNSREVLPPFNTDIREPVNGTFFFRDGENNTRTIELRILPHGEVEVEETFVVELSILSGEVDVDPRAGSITLKVLNFVTPARLISPSVRLFKKDYYNLITKGLFTEGNLMRCNLHYPAYPYSNVLSPR